MHKEIELLIEDSSGRVERKRLKVERLYCAGYTARDQEAVRRHIEELARKGVPPPPNVPTVYQLSPYLLLTDEESDSIDVVGNETSGEVEYVAFFFDEVYVTVGSDHTDRWLERFDVARSKQVCPKFVASRAWTYREARGHWDEIRIRCWTINGGSKRLYQEGKLGDILPLEELSSKLRIGRGAALFSGTVPTVTHEIVYADGYELELLDEVLGRSIRSRYFVNRISS